MACSHFLSKTPFGIQVRPYAKRNTKGSCNLQAQRYPVRRAVFSVKPTIRFLAKRLLRGLGSPAAPWRTVFGRPQPEGQQQALRYLLAVRVWLKNRKIFPGCRTAFSGKPTIRF